jgi:hypothetical protein
MSRLVAAAANQPGAEAWFLAIQADTEAYYGRLAKAREFSSRAIASAKRFGDSESAASYLAVADMRKQVGHWYDVVRSSGVSENDAETIRSAFIDPGFSL